MQPAATRQPQEAQWDRGTFIPFPHRKGAGWASSLLALAPAIYLVQRQDPPCKALGPYMEFEIAYSLIPLHPSFFTRTPSCPTWKSYNAGDWYTHRSPGCSTPSGLHRAQYWCQHGVSPAPAVMAFRWCWRCFKVPSERGSELIPPAFNLIGLG